MPFQYSGWVDPYHASIEELLLRRGDIAAHAAETIGAANARAAAASGQAWGGAMQSIGDMLAGLPQQMQRQKMDALRAEDVKAQIAERMATADQRTRGLADDAAMDRAYSPLATLGPGAAGPMPETAAAPTRDQILNSLPGHLRERAQKQFDEADTHAADAKKKKHEAATAEADYFGALANGIMQWLPDGPESTMAAAKLALDHAKEQGYEGTDELWKRLESNPANIPNVLKAVVAQSPKFADSLKPKTREITITNPDGSTTAKIVEDKPGQEFTSAPKPTKPTAEQDDQRYRDIVARGTLHQPVSAEDAAWALGYEKQKTLGPGASAAAAADRQTAAITASAAQQGRAQAFTEAQAGRKELTEKVEQPYQTAVGSANTLRDVVTAAQAGNKVAGSLQSLETTMAAIRAQGLNRINTAEIGVTANAGSIWDRVHGWFGKADAGQPVPANIQKDMLEFADILEKAAYKKYADAHKAVTTRYGLKDEKPAAPPGAPPAGTERTANGETRVWGFFNGEWGWKRK